MAKRRLTKHHTIPVSRGGGEDHVVLLDDRFHQDFHKVFGNLMPEECVEFVKRISIPGTFWNSKRLRDLRNQIQDETRQKEAAKGI